MRPRGDTSAPWPARPRKAIKGIRFTGVTGDGTCFNAARDAQLPGYVIEINELKWNLFDQHAADPCP